MMCGRFGLLHTWDDMFESYQLISTPLNVAARFNIAPTQPVVAITGARDGAGNEASFFQWGLVPSWAKEVSIGAKMINARGETVAEKPSFRAAFKVRRCIVPADAFYEWQQRAAGKQPWAIRMKSGEPMGLAGLWEHWTAPGGERLETYIILTTSANDLMAPLHARMPVILPADAYGLWLDGLQPVAALMPLLLPCEAGLLSAHPVSKRVGNVRNDDPDLLEPVDDAG
jgi:putative SOS response-associated peptidase YedK